jgi:hypothetical protein
MKRVQLLIFIMTILNLIILSFTNKFQGDGKVGWNCKAADLCVSKCKKLQNIRELVVYREKYEHRRYACFCKGYFNNFGYWADFSNGVCEFGDMDPKFILDKYELFFWIKN